MKKVAAIATAVLLIGASIIVASVRLNPSDILVDGVSVALDPDVAAVQVGVDTIGAAVTLLEGRISSLEAIDVTQLEADVSSLLALTAVLPPPSCFKFDPDHGGVPKILISFACGSFEIVTAACFADAADPTCL